MKKLLLVISFIASFSYAMSQIPNWNWARNSSSASSCCSYSSGIAIDQTDTSLFIGARCSGTLSWGGNSVSAGGDANPFVGRLDSSAKTSSWLEEYTYSGGYDYPSGFCIDNNDNAILSGWTNSGYSNPMFLEKYSKYGTLLHEITPPNSAGGGFMAVTTDNQGNIYVTGNFENGYGSLVLGSTTLSYTGNGHAVFIAKLDSSLNFIWAVDAYGTGSSDGWDVGRGITVDNQGHLFVSGGYSSQPTFYSYGSATTITPVASSGYGNLFVAEYDTNGTAMNVYTATNAGLDNGDWGTTFPLTSDSCGNLYVTGYFENMAQFGNFSITASSGHNAFVAKLSANGAWQWANGVISSNGCNGTGIALDKNSDVYTVGQYSGSASFSNSSTTVSGGNCYITKYANSTGDLQWAQSSNVPSGGVSGIAVNKQKFVYVTGSCNGSASTFGTVTMNQGYGCYIAEMDTVPARQIIPRVDSSYCPGSTDTITYTIVGGFNSDNVFTAELSDSTGSFATYTNLGSVTSNSAGKIVITIPSGTPTGSYYLIRIVSSDPATSSWANGCGAYYIKNVYPNDFYITIGGGSGTLNVSLSPLNPTTCSGGSITLKASGGNNSNATYNWINPASTADSVIVNPTRDSTFLVDITGGCGSGKTIDTFIHVTVYPDTTTLNPQYPTICDGSSVQLSMSANGTYSWSPSTGLNKATGDTVIATPTATVTYTVTGTNTFGCAVNDSDIITVNSPITTPTIKQRGDTLISSYTQGNTWTFNDTAVGNYTDSSIVITVSGWYQVTETNSVNGCSATSDSEYITGLNQLSIPANALSIYPNPTSGTINVNIKVTAHELQGLSLQLTDVLGRTVYTRSSLNYTNEIDLSQLASGVYFISVINNNGRTVLPVIKQ